MGIFKKPREAPAQPIQIRNGQRHPFGVFDSYVPLSGGEIRLKGT